MFAILVKNFGCEDIGAFSYVLCRSALRSALSSNCHLRTECEVLAFGPLSIGDAAYRMHLCSKCLFSRS